ncbi:MAG: tyrosine-type recombinase/integrase [Planctomycetes bacterium]|nr:tyrosine-type recombinase/integrase [Planctomycetota bacterium]
MLSNSNAQDGKNSIDNVFKDISCKKSESLYFQRFVESNDFSSHTIRAMKFDIRKFAKYFTEANKEPFDSVRITTMDLASFRRYLRESQRQAVSTVNRALVTMRRYLDWLVDEEVLKTNPAKAVKELNRQQLAPKGLERNQVRKLLREVELRTDIRSKAIFSMFLHTGCRVSDLVQTEIEDIIINDRSGSVIFRNGKGNKERQVPLTLACRRALQEYLQVRPPVQIQNLFIGERGALTDIGIRALCNKYSAICGFKIHPHLLRHSMAKQFLKDTNNDIVSLAQILGHQNIQTTARYSQRNQDDLAQITEQLNY